MTDYERTTTRQVTTEPAYSNAGVGPTAASVRTTDRAYVPADPSGAATAARIVTFAFGVLQALLILRIILLLLVANEGNDLVALVMTVTDPFVEPFRGMFSLDKVTAGESVFDVAALVAIVGWTLIEMLILAALRIFMRRPSEA